MLLDVAKCRGYSFHHFWVIIGKPTGREGIKLPSPLLPRLELKYHAGFRNIKEISSLCQLAALKKISFYSQKSIISTLSLSENS